MNIFHISFYLKLSSKVCFTSLLCLKYIRWLMICFYVLQHNPPSVPCFRLAWICTVSISGTVFNQLSCIRQLHSVWPLSATVVLGSSSFISRGTHELSTPQQMIFPFVVVAVRLTLSNLFHICSLRGRSRFGFGTAVQRQGTSCQGQGCQIERMKAKRETFKCYLRWGGI